MHIKVANILSTIDKHERSVKLCNAIIADLNSIQINPKNPDFGKERHEYFRKLITEQFEEKVRIKKIIEELQKPIALKIYQNGKCNDVRCIYYVSDEHVVVEDGEFDIVIGNNIKLHGNCVGGIVVYEKDIKSFIYTDELEIIERYDFHVVPSTAPEIKLNYKSPGFLSSIIKNPIIKRSDCFVSIFEGDRRISTHKILNGSICNALNVEISTADGRINTRTINSSVPITLKNISLDRTRFDFIESAKLDGNSDLEDLKKILTKCGGTGTSLWELSDGRKLKFERRGITVWMNGNLVTKFQNIEDRIIIETR